MNLQNNFNKLNLNQKQVVMHTDTPLLIIAGPGTGKTFTLTSRIAYLIENLKVSPEHILALTFTRRAAKEMKDRLLEMLGKNISDKDIFIGTLHAFGYKLLLGESFSGGNFSIYSPDDSVLLLREIIKEKKIKNPDAGNLLNKISIYKNFEANDNIQSQEFIKIFEAYQNRLREYNALDFDDLLLESYRLLNENKEIKLKYQKKFTHIFIDEYQDINNIQYKLIKLLALAAQNLTVIGDPDQAIYAFRGANIENFTQFKKDFPLYKEISLENNYRSSGIILDASQQVIVKNKNRLKKFLHTELDKGINIEIMDFTGELAEAEMVAKRIEQMIGGTSFFSHDSNWANSAQSENRSFSDFAILYRFQVQGNIFEKVLKEHNIPYQRVKPMNDESNLETLISKYSCRLSQNPSDKIAQIRLLQYSGTLNLELNSLNPECKKYLYNEIENIEEDTFEYNIEKVTLITMHGAKGLEFPVVFITGCEQGIIPYLKQNSVEELEEERRLFYVGMTRAKERLILSSANKRFLFGKTEERNKSPFINDISEELKEIYQEKKKKKKVKKEPENKQLSLF